MLKKSMIFVFIVIFCQCFITSCKSLNAVDSMVGNTYNDFTIKTISRDEYSVTIEIEDNLNELELEMSTDNMTDEEIAENIKEILLETREDLLNIRDVE